MSHTNETVANRIKTVRRMKGMSQSDVARALNIHPSTLSYYESAKRSIPNPVLMDMAGLFDMSLDELMKGVGEHIGEPKWIPVKRPLPLFSPTWFQRGLLALSYTLMVSAFPLGNETTYILGVLTLLVFALTLAISLFRHQKHGRTYIRLGPRDAPGYRFMEDGTFDRRHTFTLMFHAAFLLVGLFLMQGIMLMALAEDLSEADNVVINLFFIIMSIFLIGFIIQGLRNRLIRKSLPYHKASLTLGTLGLVSLEGILAFGYVIHGYILLQALIIGDVDIGMNPWFFILLFNLIFFGIYALFKELHRMRLKYHFTRSLE